MSLKHNACLLKGTHQLGSLPVGPALYLNDPISNKPPCLGWTGLRRLSGQRMMYLRVSDEEG